ncbi:hypothetical protein HNQ57_002249 [Zhongshania antarctica]|uniref:Uncharacterized protein n=1 Tax=Zhongshania antarctica TaxID=641702 RepID=A0A840R6I2_9GAMM|nr:hypothetical protein [Zhongshania antarctica]MBB5187971.1 hypothetical protein [Zhongshania antarctica]
MTKRFMPSLTLGVSMLFSISAAHAQVPALGMLPTGAGLNFSKLSALDLGGGLAGSLASLDALNIVGSQDLVPLAGPVTTFNNLLPTLSNPAKLVPGSLGGPDILFGFVPSSEVLYNNPAAILNYILNGGILVSSGLSAIPSLPIISQPLNSGSLGGFELPDISGALPADVLPLELLSPSSAIDQVLGLGAQFTAMVPAL